MEFLIYLMIGVCLIIVITMFGFSIKLLRDTQKEAKMKSQEVNGSKDTSVK